LTYFLISVVEIRWHCCCSVGSDASLPWLLLEFQCKTWTLVFIALCKLCSQFTF